MEELLIGTTDRTTLVYIADPASTDGSGKTGLAHSDMTVSYTRAETDNDVVVTDVTSSLNAITDLTDAHNDWGWKEVSSTLAPGLYRLDIADAVFATGAWYAVVSVAITTSLASVTPKGFKLVAYDPSVGVNATHWLGTALATPATAGYPVTTHKVGTGTGELNSASGEVVSASVTGNVGGDINGDVVGRVVGSGATAFTAAGVWATRDAAENPLALENTLSNIVAAIGAFSASGANTIFGFLRAMCSKALTAPSDIGGTFDPATDSLEAVVDVGVNMKAISGDTAAADNAEAFFDGTGYAGTNNVIPTTTTVTNPVNTGRTVKRIAPGGGGDYLTAAAAATALASTTGDIKLICDRGNIGTVQIEDFATCSHLWIVADEAAKHKNDVDQPLAETAHFTANLNFEPTTGGPSKVTIEGLRSSGVSTGIFVDINDADRAYSVEVRDCLFHNAGTGGGALDQVIYLCTQGTLHFLHVNNTHIFTSTGKTKGYVISYTNPAGGQTATIYGQVYNNTGNSNGGTLITDTGSVIDGFGNSGGGSGGTEVMVFDVKNNIFCGCVPATGDTDGAINVQTPAATTITGSHNFTNDSSADNNGLTSGTTGVVVGDVFESYLTTNRQLSTAATRDAGYALPQDIMGSRVKSGSVWDVGSHEYQAGLSATQLGYVNTSLSTLATSTALSSLTSTVGAAGVGLTAITGLITDIYHADIYYTRDDAGAEDTYKAVWFKNGVRITSGITSPTIQVVKEADGTDLIASTAMTEIGSTEAFKYTATTTARQTSGESCLVIVGATIDGSARTFIRSLGRDSTA